MTLQGSETKEPSLCTPPLLFSSSTWQQRTSKTLAAEGLFRWKKKKTDSESVREWQPLPTLN